MRLRQCREEDCKVLAELFFNIVHVINAKDYSPEQLSAWATGQTDLKQWNTSFLSHDTVVAEIGHKIVGFGDIDKRGDLDRLFVHANYQGIGIASAICDKLERQSHVGRVITHASITAKGFFEKRWYKVVRKQRVQRRGILLTNYKMELCFPR